MADQVGHERSLEGFVEWLEGSLHRAGHAVVAHDDLVDSWGGTDCGLGHRGFGGELDFDPVDPDAVELFQIGNFDELAGADDAHPVADMLDLGQNVGGEKYGRASIACLSPT